MKYVLVVALGNPSCDSAFYWANHIYCILLSACTCMIKDTDRQNQILDFICAQSKLREHIALTDENVEFLNQKTERKKQNEYQPFPVWCKSCSK